MWKGVAIGIAIISLIIILIVLLIVIPIIMRVMGEEAKRNLNRPGGEGDENILDKDLGKESASKGVGGEEYELQEESRLKELGYDTTKSHSERWKILTTKAVPELGLQKVAGHIAWLCQSRKAQRGGRERYADAIRKWEHDLDRLKREVYPTYRSQFDWPRSEP